MQPSSNGNGAANEPLGWVDGSVAATTRAFTAVLQESAIAQLDDLVATTQQLPDGRQVTHYGIVTEGLGEIEGAQFASDTQRISAEKTMPGLTARTVNVQVLRTVPEMWLPPQPGAEVLAACGDHRDRALFLDQMDKPLAMGLDQSGQPVFAEFTFINGEKGGHLSISGMSGVATKTSYATFFLYQLLETPHGQALLGPHAPQTRAIVFNTKGEDLLHLDRPNSKFASHPEALEQWLSLGVSNPGPFTNVRLFAPRSAGSHEHSIATDATSRSSADVRAFGWTPAQFIREGLLRFCFADANDERNQLSFVEQRVRIQLARHAYPLIDEPGAVVLAEPPTNCSYDLQRIVQTKRDPKLAADGAPIRTFSDLVDFLTDRLAPEYDEDGDAGWGGRAQAGTRLAFLRRLYAQTPRIGRLIALGVEPVTLEKAVTVVDIHSLHDDAQRFVVGALLSVIFEEKQGKGREPLRFIMLDELNKYAPRQGSSPIKELLVDIAARGRSLGVLLIGAQQSARDVERAIVLNSSVKVVGRLDSGEAGEYGFLTPELRERTTRFLPGTMVLDQPLIPAPLPIRFPFPAYATCVAESRSPASVTDDVFKGL